MTPRRGNTILCSSSQQLPCLRLMRSFRNYRDTRTPAGVPRLACSFSKTKTKTKTKNQSLRSFLHILKQTCDKKTNNSILRYTKGFVRHRHNLERTKTFVLGFVFVFILAHEQAVSTEVPGHHQEQLTQTLILFLLISPTLG